MKLIKCFNGYRIRPKDVQTFRIVQDDDDDDMFYVVITTYNGEEYDILETFLSEDAADECISKLCNNN